MTGRWNTIACRRDPFAPSHLTRPVVGLSRPWQTLMSTLFPAPLGPRMTVRGPASIVAVTRSRMRLPFATKLTLSSARGSIALAVPALGDAFDHARAGIEDDDERDEDETQPERERQIAFARFERDRRRHHP